MIDDPAEPRLDPAALARVVRIFRMALARRDAALAAEQHEQPAAGADLPARKRWTPGAIQDARRRLVELTDSRAPLADIQAHDQLDRLLHQGRPLRARVRPAAD